MFGDDAQFNSNQPGADNPPPVDPNSAHPNNNDNLDPSQRLNVLHCS